MNQEDLIFNEKDNTDVNTESDRGARIIGHKMKDEPTMLHGLKCKIYNYDTYKGGRKTRRYCQDIGLDKKSS